MSKFYYSIAVMLFTLVVCSSDGYYANGAGPDTNRYVRKPYDTAISLRHAQGLGGIRLTTDSSNIGDGNIIDFYTGVSSLVGRIYSDRYGNLQVFSLLDTLYLGSGFGPVYINNAKVPSTIQDVLWTRAGGQLDPATSTDTVHVSRLGIGTVTGFNARLAVGGADSANVGMTIVRTDKNLVRTSLSQARDTSAVTISSTASGKFQFTIRGPTGNLQFQVDSTGTAHGVFSEWDSAAYGGVYISDDHPDSIAFTYTGSVHTVGSVHAAAVQGYKWTSGGVLKNVTVGDSSMTVGVTGIYDVAWSMSIGSGAGVAPNAKFNAYIYVNNVKEEKTGSMRMLSGSNDIGQLVCTAMSLSLNANDIVKLKLINVDDSNGNTVVVYYAKMHVTRIQ